jgi:hypothetical protein
MKRRCAAVGLIVIGAIILIAAPASAHPLGNFSVNTAAALRVAPDGVRVDYVVDLAEIPTLQAKPDLDADGDGRFSDAEQVAYRERECARVAAQSHLSVDGSDRAVVGAGVALTITPGLAALTTSRIECRLDAAGDLPRGVHDVRFTSDYAKDYAGWHEVTAQGDGATLVQSDVAAASPSRMLTTYPAAGVTAPPDVHDATLRAEPGGPRLADVPPE